MPALLYKRYVWLLEQLSQGGKTYDEINYAWKISSLNDTGEPLPKRTLHNHIEAIADMFGFNIRCHRQGGYKYVVEDSQNGTLPKAKEELLNQLLISNIQIEQQDEQYILIPRIEIHVDISKIKRIQESIARQRKIKILWGWVSGDRCMEDRWVEIEPYYIKGYILSLTETEWYLFGLGVKGVVQVYELGNIKDIVMLEDSFIHPHTPFEEIEDTAFQTPISACDDDDSLYACIYSHISSNRCE